MTPAVLSARMPTRLLAAASVAAWATSYATAATVSGGLAPSIGAVHTQRQMMHDPRDLTPMIRQFPETYTGEPLVDRSSTDAKARKDPKSAGSQVSTATAPQPSNRTALDNVDLYYGFFLNGPSLGQPLGTTYSRFQLGTWPMYIYHTVDAQYHFDRNNLIGAELSAHHDIQSGITPFGFASPVDPKFDIYDPQFWYTRKNAINARSFSTDITFSVWPGLTSYSIDEMKEYFSFGLDTTWFLKLPNRRWSAYFSTRLKPTLYAELSPGDGYSREWGYANAGYYVGYSLANSWQVNLSGVFDCAFYATNDALWNRGDAYDDFAQLELNYFAGRTARIGAYVQTMIWNPSLTSSIVGLDITLNILTAK